MADTKRCSACRKSKPLTEFHVDRGTKTGRKSQCSACRTNVELGRQRKFAKTADDRDARIAAEARARLESDFDSLRPEDFDVSVGNDPKRDPAMAARAAREKRQEYNRQMGEHANAIRNAKLAADAGEDVLGVMPGESAKYGTVLAEQERRFQNRKLARSVSLLDAAELLNQRRYKELAATYFRDKIKATGYAAKRKNRKAKRSVCLMLSDLHLGAELSGRDNPIAFGAVEEARRLEYVLRQTLDYKPQYREQSELVLMLGGDMIEGYLLHDLRDGAPLAEQKCIFWRHFRSFIAHCAAQYPSVRVFCQPGNHGRDKVRHPGRATSRKWDGHEWEMYWALREMSSGLPTVKWQIDLRAVTVIDLYGASVGLSHGDTEIKLGDPDTRSVQNAQALDRINATRMYGVEFAAWVFGHFHKPRYHPRNPRVLFNGGLLPPNGHARTQGYIGEPCGQWLWEAVEGYPVGDLRFIEVSESQDRDEQLGKLIVPFRID